MNKVENQSGHDDALPGPIQPSLAAQFMQAGCLSFTRSFRLHRKRGGFCQRGWCYQCKARLTDGRNVLACQSLDVTPSQVIRPHPFFRWITIWVDKLTPFFYHQRFLRPVFLRQFYLGVIRRMSGTLPIASSESKNENRSWEDLTCDTLVIGGGLAGMQAAWMAHARHKHVILVEAEQLGGSARYLLSTTEALSALKENLVTAEVETYEDCLCIGLYESASQALCIGKNNNMLITYRELVVATGAYDRTLTIKGNDLPGIVGVRGFEKLVAEDAIDRRMRIGIYGWFEEIDRLLHCVQTKNIEIAWIAGPSAVPHTDVAMYSNSRLDQITGHSQVTGLRFENGFQAKCNLLVLGFSQPSYELQMHAGQYATIKSTLPIVIPEGEPLVPMIVVGEAAGATDPFEALEHAEHAIDRWYKGIKSIPTYRDHPAPITDIHPDSFICHCEDVRVSDIQQTIDDGFASVELIKRRTGAGTGPCQGKLCHAQFVACAVAKGVPVTLPTMRPFMRPVPLCKFLGRSDV